MPCRDGRSSIYRPPGLFNLMLESAQGADGLGIESGLFDVVELLSEVAERLEELEPLDANEQRSAAALSGDTPAATENRAIHSARISISREWAREMRADLNRLRAKARQMADEARRVSTHTCGKSIGRLSASRPNEVHSVGGDHLHRFGAAARALKQTHDLDRLYQLLADGLREMVPGAAVVGVCALRVGGSEAGALELVAGEPPLAQVIEVENTTGRGPCQDALAGQVVINVSEMPEAGRWPEIAKTMGRQGWRSVLICPFAERTDRHRGALVAYSRSARGIHHSDREAVEYLAELAGVSLSGSRRIAALLGAVESRDLIGQAKGMLMLRDNIDADQAFTRLVEASQHANLKLRDVAAWLVEMRGVVS
ncbi:hypothetical protein GCM10023203_39790 [Actinomycetospora straminea]|uniref:ANTAR domain-containing protein n=1 Tax=Actinomycetospora straminea TaxID=663607 RepID=A0ABP9ERN8_9PSEU